MVLEASLNKRRFFCLRESKGVVFCRKGVVECKIMQDVHAIKELLNAKEGEQVQFKEAKNRFDSSEAARICCALSNCCGGKRCFCSIRAYKKRLD